MALRDVLQRAEQLCGDAELATVARHKTAGGRAVGCLPAYVPTELVDAAGALPVHLLGGGTAVEVVQGDAFFQSAICHLPRSIIELGLRGALDSLDALIVPSTCDVLRNLTGISQVLWPGRPVIYLDLPQRYDDMGLKFYRADLAHLVGSLEKILATTVDDAKLRRAIAVQNARRRLLRALEDLRASAPWSVPTSELYLLVRAGAVLSPADHVRLLEDYLGAARQTDRPVLDVARVVLTGAFCEPPPLGFVRTLERAGCAIVADDLLLGMRWLSADVDEQGDPLDALARAYLLASPAASCRYEGDRPRTESVLEQVRRRDASGVILASPSFCDPALLDRPGLLDALERAAIPSVQIQYAENSADFGSVREQAGTFADALRLWEATGT